MSTTFVIFVIICKDFTYHLSRMYVIAKTIDANYHQHFAMQIFITKITTNFSLL